MAPAADVDPKLLLLQGKVATLRAQHSSLVERADLLERTKYYASAQALRLLRDRTKNELAVAFRDLDKYLERREKRRTRCKT